MARWTALLVSGIAVTQVSIAASDKSAFQDRLLWGECELNQDPELNDETQWPKLCLKGHVAQQALIRSNYHELNREFQYGEAYFGLHANSLLSMHGRVNAYRFSMPQGGAEKETESLFLQVGNVTLHRFRLAMGRLNLPFGLDLRPLPEIYGAIYKTRAYWLSAPYGVRIGWEDLRNVQFDVGVVTDKKTLDGMQGEDKPKDPRMQWSARVMVDIAALGGTRFIFSLMDDNPNERRVGGAIMTRDTTGGITAFEWVRRYFRPKPIDRAFDQILRFQYVGNRANPFNWLFEYEDEFKHQWLASLGFEHSFFRYGRLRLTTSYVKPRTVADVPHWLATAGVQAEL